MISLGEFVHCPGTEYYRVQAVFYHRGYKTQILDMDSRRQLVFFKSELNPNSWDLDKPALQQ